MDDDLKAVLEAMEHRLAQRIDRLAQGQVELRTVMMDRFERVEDKLTRLQEDVSVNMMAVTHQYGLRRGERDNVDQLTALVLKMEQQILRLETDVYELKKAS